MGHWGGVRVTATLVIRCRLRKRAKNKQGIRYQAPTMENEADISISIDA